MPAEILMSRQGDKLVPHDALASEDVQRLGNGVFMVKIKKPRSLPHNRIYWACLRSICQSGGFDEGEEALHCLTKIMCNISKLISLNGMVYKVPDSTRFQKMDQAAFNAFFADALAFWEYEGLSKWINPDLRQQLEEGKR